MFDVTENLGEKPVIIKHVCWPSVTHYYAFDPYVATSANSRDISYLTVTASVMNVVEAELSKPELCKTWICYAAMM